jgi:hypothetical protein
MLPSQYIKKYSFGTRKKGKPNPKNMERRLKSSQENNIDNHAQMLSDFE